MAVLAFGVGFLVSLMVGADPRLAEEMASWPVAEGEVMESRATPGNHRDSGPRVVVVYTYRVDGREYKGDRIDFDVSTWDGRPVPESLARYPKGKRVEVRYDPRDPARCALERVVYDFGDKILIHGPTVLYVVGGLLIALACLLEWSSKRVRLKAGASGGRRAS